MALLKFPLEIKSSPRKLYFTLAAFAVFIALCLWVARGVGDDTPSVLDQIIGWFGVIFFSGFMIANIWLLITPAKVQLRLTKESLHDLRLSERPIPWRDIKRVSEWAYRKRKCIIVLSVEKEVEDAIGLTRLTGWSRSANAVVGADGLCISAGGLEIGYQELLQIIKDHVREAQEAPGRVGGGPAVQGG